VKATIDLWVAAAGISTGRLFRCVCRAGKHWGDGVSERVVWHVVKQYARKLGLAQVAPHDLRRFVCKAVPCIRRRIGSDSILAGSRFRANDRTLPRMQTADSRSRERQHRDRTAAKLLWIGAQWRLYGHVNLPAGKGRGATNHAKVRLPSMGDPGVRIPKIAPWSGRRSACTLQAEFNYLHSSGTATKPCITLFSW
jgi:hypothetical protein